MKFPWEHNRRFNAYAQYFQREFGGRVQKLTVDAGFNCPNRDGTVARGGCTYCLNDAFNPSYCHPSKTVKQQLLEGMEFHRKRYRRAKKYLAYFQAFSNTYASLEKLKQVYNEALQFEEIIGLVIGTRPDCIDDEKLDYFSKLAEKHYVIIEYGIESCYNQTLQRINRGHDFEQSIEAINKTAERGLKTGAHIIFGLPGESEEMMMKEAGILSGLPLNNIKFHQLQIIKGTAIAREYKQKPEDFRSFGLDEYADFIIRFIERLNPDFVVERFAGEVPPRYLVETSWGKIRNDQLLNLIEKKLEEKDSYQGKHYPPGPEQASLHDNISVC